MTSREIECIQTTWRHPTHLSLRIPTVDPIALRWCNDQHEYSTTIPCQRTTHGHTMNATMIHLLFFYRPLGMALALTRPKGLIPVRSASRKTNKRPPFWWTDGYVSILLFDIDGHWLTPSYPRRAFPLVMSSLTSSTRITLGNTTLAGLLTQRYTTHPPACAVACITCSSSTPTFQQYGGLGA